MLQRARYVTLLPALPILLAHLAGTLVATTLFIRHKSTPSISAITGFGLLFVLNLANLAAAPPAGLQVGTAGRRGLWIARACVGSCCSIFEVVPVACIVVAISQAVSGTSAQERARDLATTSGKVIASNE